MDEVVEKEKERKSRKNPPEANEEDERIVELKRELKEQEVRIQRNKVEIAKLRKNLDHKYDVNKIVEKESELKHLKKQLMSLEAEKETLEKVRRTQDRALRGGEDKEAADKIAKMEQELRDLTHKTKKQVETINEKEKQIKKLHEAYTAK
jgi:chromosome segregation ATPase